MIKHGEIFTGPKSIYFKEMFSLKSLLVYSIFCSCFYFDKKRQTENTNDNHMTAASKVIHLFDIHTLTSTAAEFTQSCLHAGLQNVK